jgi:hypothetical protein
MRLCAGRLRLALFFCLYRIETLNPAPQALIPEPLPSTQAWDIFILLLLLYTCIEVPYSLAFNSDSLDALELVFDVCFCLDIIINFCTAQVDPRNRPRTGRAVPCLHLVNHECDCGGQALILASHTGRVSSKNSISPTNSHSGFALHA